MVTVYTTGPACHKCTLTKNAMAKGGIDFVEVLLGDVPDEAAVFKAEGRLVAPIVVTDDETWHDFRIDKIRALIKGRAEMRAAA